MEASVEPPTSSPPVEWAYWDPDFAAILALFADADRDAYKVYDASLVDLLDRVEWLLVRFAHSAVESASPLVNPLLDQAEQEIEAIRDAFAPLSALVESGSFTSDDLTEARSTLEDAAAEFAGTVADLPEPVAAEVLTAARDEVRRVRQSASQSIRSIQDAAQQALTEATTELQSEIAKVSASLAGLAGDATTLDEKVDDATERLDKTAAAVQTALDQTKGQITALEESLQVRAEEALAKIGASAKTQRETVEADWEERAESIETANAELLRRSAATLEDAEKTLNATATAAHSKQYKDTAKGERNAAIAYQVLGTVAVGCAVGVIWTIVATDADEAASWEAITTLTLARLAVSSLLAGLAVYFFRQANQHRHHQSEARQRALIMATHHSFIATLDEDVQAELSENMAKGPMFQLDGFRLSPNSLAAVPDLGTSSTVRDDA